MTHAQPVRARAFERSPGQLRATRTARGQSYDLSRRGQEAGHLPCDRRTRRGVVAGEVMRMNSRVLHFAAVLLLAATAVPGAAGAENWPAWARAHRRRRRRQRRDEPAGRVGHRAKYRLEAPHAGLVGGRRRSSGATGSSSTSPSTRTTSSSDASTGIRASRCGSDT